MEIQVKKSLIVSICRGKWKDDSKVHQLLHWTKKELRIEDINDWKQFSTNHLRKLHWRKLLERNQVILLFYSVLQIGISFIFTKNIPIC